MTRTLLWRKAVCASKRGEYAPCEAKRGGYGIKSLSETLSTSYNKMPLSVSSETTLRRNTTSLKHCRNTDNLQWLLKNWFWWLQTTKTSNSQLVYQEHSKTWATPLHHYHCLSSTTGLDLIKYWFYEEEEKNNFPVLALWEKERKLSMFSWFPSDWLSEWKKHLNIFQNAPLWFFNIELFK